MRGLRSISPLLLLSVLAGCRDDLTQVVVVIQSDLVVPTETDSIQTLLAEGPLPPDPGGFNGFGGSGPLAPSFPLSFGVKSDGHTPSFSFNVQLMKGFNSGNPSLIVVKRTITDVRFVDEQTLMLVVPLLRACACQGTSCPAPGDPQCDGIDQPTLQPFDPAIAPPSGKLGESMFGPPLRLSTPAASAGGSAP